ncbi:E3 SUMO-protein ligase ZBED1-like [Corythoichthys intestinalis]|uniref:E3 SUMO-protein ligase ZBED1-like n=1 Tax=Corythoichthys intestinalis TaxID=161448 RepID=UPI0025A60F4C|nr:E3 SUMO-protein ligase ZBED1-like [Corythoichthys intestinalis]
MAPVKLVTTTMSEDHRPTLSMISPVKAKLKKNFEASEKDSVVIREMKQAFRNDLEKRYAGLDDLFNTAAALDPRFKSLPFLSDHDSERTFMTILAEATALHSKATGIPAESDAVQTDPCQSDPAHEDTDITTEDVLKDDVPPCKKKKMSVLDQLFGEDFQVRMAARSAWDRASDEVKRYRDCES